MLQDKYILLDRDGVINLESDAFVKTEEEWIPIPGSLEAIALLNKNGFKIAVITNQSGLSRGFFDIAMLRRIHAKMHYLLAAKGGKIDDIYFCPHGPEDGCQCRKPKPGLLTRFSMEKKITLDGIPFVGDTLRDIQAGERAGASPLLVKTGKGSKTLADNPQLHIPVFENLNEAAKFIISR